MPTRKQKANWRDIALELGWDDSEGRIPVLEEIVKGDGKVAFSFYPLLGRTGVAQWDVMADQMAHRLGYPTKRVVPHPSKEDRVVFVFCERDLPRIYKPSAIPDHGPMLFEIGEGPGHKAILDLENSPNTLFTGPTRWGKGVGQRSMMMQAIDKGWNVVVFNVDDAPEFGWVSEAGGNVATGDGDEALDALDWLIEQMQTNMSLISGVDHWLELPEGIIVPTLVVLDEFGGLLENREAEKRIHRLISRGSKAGFFHVATIQIALAESVPSKIRTNFSNRILVGPADESARKVLFGGLAEDTDTMHLRRGIKGRGLMTAEIGLEPVQIAYYERSKVLSTLNIKEKSIHAGV